MPPLLFLDPGHFHAALTLRVPQARAADEVFVYAREGAELRDFLALVERFNRRSPHPTRWRPVVTTSDDPLERLVGERRGDVVVLAGKNGGKAPTIRRLHESGFHVLADQPWLVEPADLQHARAGLEGWPLAAEIMTGRHDVAAGLVKRLVGAPALFGAFRDDGPAIERRACTIWRSSSMAPPSDVRGGSSTCACRGAARSTFPPTSWTRRSGSWTATPRRQRSSRPARGRRECPRRRSGGSPERRGSRRGPGPSSPATRR